MGDQDFNLGDPSDTSWEVGFVKMGGREGLSVNVRAHFNTKGISLEQRPIPLTSPDLKATLQHVAGATTCPASEAWVWGWSTNSGTWQVETLPSWIFIPRL